MSTVSAMERTARQMARTYGHGVVIKKIAIGVVSVIANRRVVGYKMSYTLDDSHVNRRRLMR